MEKYYVTGMTCAACQVHVERAVSGVPGVESVSVSLLTNSMTVEGSADSSAVEQAVRDAGYGATLAGAKASPSAPGFDTGSETKRLIRRLAASVVFLLILMYITMGHNMWNWPIPAFLRHNLIALGMTQMLLALAVMIINKDFFISGWRSSRHLSPNMDTLVALGSGISFGWSLYVLYRLTVMATGGADPAEMHDVYHNMLYFESAAMIPALITVGKTLEAFSKGKTTDALKNLMRMAPRTAVLERDGAEVTVPVEEVRPGDIFCVRPGETVPVDGVITDGTAAVDESSLTGESVPVDKSAGENVSAATINRSGFFKARATRVGEDTSFAQIIKMVEQASSTKAPIARIADKAAGIFVPVVLVIALVVMTVWLAVGSGPAYALERAICVLVISWLGDVYKRQPVAIMVGSGVGARNGILFKTGEVLENTGRIAVAAVDKTGTVTSGKPAVTDIIENPGTERDVLIQTACTLEHMSEHPLAAAISRAAEERGFTPGEAKGFTAVAGNGLTARIEGVAAHGGSAAYISQFASIPAEMQSQADRLSAEGKTPTFFESHGWLLGMIAVADVIREDTPEAVRQLGNLGVRVVMLTGDNQRTARAVADAAGISEVMAGILPEGKEKAVRSLRKFGRVAMVGDGINDAPAITAADTGIAIGAGTDVAIDSADVVLMNSSLTDVAAAVRLSRATLRNIRQNLFWAFAYNIILIPMAAGAIPGIRISPMWGAAAMSLSSFTVCMNALRLNLFRPGDPSRDRAPAFLRKQSAIPAETAPDDNNSEPEVKQMTKTIRIEGMMCPHCEAHVKKALEALEGVASAVPSHEKGNAVLELTADVPDEALKQAVEGAGYTFLG